MSTGEQVSIGSVNWPPSVLYACIHVCIIYVQSRVYMWYNVYVLCCCVGSVYTCVHMQYVVGSSPALGISCVNK